MISVQIKVVVFLMFSYMYDQSLYLTKVFGQEWYPGIGIQRKDEFQQIDNLVLMNFASLIDISFQTTSIRFYQLSDL